MIAPPSLIRRLVITSARSALVARSIHSILAGLALAAPAATARAELTITDVAACYGRLGPAREELQVFPTDELMFRYTIRGAAPDERGAADVSVAITVHNAAGAEVFNDETPTRGVMALGGGTLPGIAAVRFDEGTPPGEYSVTVTARDHRSRDEAAFRRVVTLQPAEFTIINPRFYYDADGDVEAPAGGVVGQTLRFSLRVIGMSRANDRIDAVMAFQVRDAEGTNLMPQPIEAAAQSEDKEEVASAKFVTFTGDLVLNRPGKFELVVRVTDRNAPRDAENTVTFSTPVVVAAP